MYTHVVVILHMPHS